MATQERSARLRGGWIGENRQHVTIQRGSPRARVEPAPIRRTSLGNAARSRAIQRGRRSGAVERCPLPTGGSRAAVQGAEAHAARSAEPHGNPRSDGPSERYPQGGGRSVGEGDVVNAVNTAPPRGGPTQTTWKTRSPCDGSETPQPKRPRHVSQPCWIRFDAIQSCSGGESIGSKSAPVNPSSSHT